MRRLSKKFVWALVCVNSLCAVLHFIFEITLLSTQFTYREFLLIENLSVGVVFLGFAVNLITSDDAHRPFILKFQALFWGVFLGSVVVFKPEATTLDLVKIWLPVSQKAVLIVVGSLALLVTLMLAIRPPEKNRS